MISVIVPAYNAGKTLYKCLDSVIGQTYKDLEIIIVDDGSTDNTAEIMKGYAKQYSNIRCIHQENAGVSRARNIGIENSVGEYLYFIDADDHIEDDTFKLLIDADKRHALDIVASEIIDKNGTSAIRNAFAELPDLYADTKDDIGTYAFFLRMGSAVGKLYRSKTILDNDIKFLDNIDLAEDLIFTHTVLLNSGSIAKVSRSRYIVQNINEDSLSKRYVKNIEKIVRLQERILFEVFAMYPSYETVWKMRFMDIKANNCIMLVKNLFLNDCPFSWQEKIDQVNDLIDRGECRIFRQMSKKNGPKTRMDKIYAFIFMSGSPLMICLFFWLKEQIKRMIVNINKGVGR